MNLWQRNELQFRSLPLRKLRSDHLFGASSGSGLLLVIYSLAWLPDAALWFSDAGVLKSITAEALHNDNYKSLYMLLPQTPEVLSGR